MVSEEESESLTSRREVVELVSGKPFQSFCVILILRVYEYVKQTRLERYPDQDRGANKRAHSKACLFLVLVV